MILVTITRIAGIRLDSQIDSVWESYFLIVAAEIGVVLASVSTYRALFVSHRKRIINEARDRGHTYSPNRQLIGWTFVSSPWRSKAKGQSTPDNDRGDQDSHFDKDALPNIPPAHMSGVRTFINGCGQRTDASDIMESQVFHDKHDNDDWPL
ncbi:MAG: hypothetical protein Q9199_003716 [Rusavskia elegans]